MKYDIDLFVRIINFIVQHNDEPELFLELDDGTLIEFTCYKDFIDVWINEDYDNLIKFENVTDFLDNLKIDGLSLRELWGKVIYIDDAQTIYYDKEPEEQFFVHEGWIWYTPKK